MKPQPSLMVLGASGSVARAFLRRLSAQRRRFGKLVLVDRNAGVTTDRTLDPATLDWVFVREWLRLPEHEEALLSLFKQHAIDIVVDLTADETLPTLAAADKAGVCYVSTALVHAKISGFALVAEVQKQAADFKKAAHVVCAGMNPGAVNTWVVLGVERYGKPDEVIHFEHDTSRPAEGWRPMVTWSKRDFLMETTWLASGIATPEKVEPLTPNSLLHRVDLKPVLEPIVELERYPQAFPVLHEENITLARRYGFKSRFLYAIDSRTMDFLVQAYKERGTVQESELALGDNVKIPLDGSDLVGVMLDYGERRVYYTNRTPNRAFMGMNATCAQVAVGLFCAVYVLMTEPVEPGVYFPEELPRTDYRRLIFENMRIDETICERKAGRFERVKFTPMLRLPKPADAERVLL